MKKHTVLKGAPYPLGATFDGEGVNFALFSSSAHRVQVCLFNAKGGREERLDLPEYTDEVFHGYIPGLKPGQLYGFRVFGPYEPEKGLRFNPHKLLADPYAKQVTGPFLARNAQLGYVPSSPLKDLSFSRTNSAPFVPKCVVYASEGGEVVRPQIPWGDTLIYETHLKGFTARYPGLDARLRGTCAGMGQKKVVAYLKNLGITTVEFLPVAAFMTSGFLLEKGLTNYWGYDPITFMAPHAPYLATNRVTELKQMIRVFHEAGIEVILDVVFNHTGEGNEMGPTLCYRGIDNAAYYRLTQANPRYYDDTTGCGASFNLAHPRALQLVMDALRWWALEMGVDGFRFDLASTLARDDANQYAFESAFLTVVQQDPLLQRLKMIAEPWDLGWGGYQVGGFRPGWAEWNDQFRDTTRRFWNGEEGQASAFAARMAGSADLFEKKGRKAWETINFVTAHDGFTLADLVSFNQKHNLANAEENRDGTNANYSWNGGVEGKTTHPDVVANRMARAKALMGSLLLAKGTPMIRGGDEVLSSQKGNNNAYALDAPNSWMSWSPRPRRRQMLSFTRQLIQFRQQHPLLRGDAFWTPEEMTFFRPDGTAMQPDDWQFFVRSLAWRLEEAGEALFVICNAFDGEIDYVLPPAGNAAWVLALDSSGRLSLNEVFETVRVPERSLLVFERKSDE